MNLLPSSTVHVFPPPTRGIPCSALRYRHLLWPLLTSARTSRHLSMPVAQGIPADLPGYDAPTFTLMPVGFTPCHSVQVLGFNDNGRLTPTRRLVSASCSSGQRFAFGFLQIRGHPRHPCRSANTSPCRACRGLSPPSKCALPGAPQKNPPFRWINEDIILWFYCCWIVLR